MAIGRDRIVLRVGLCRRNALGCKSCDPYRLCHYFPSGSQKANPGLTIMKNKIEYVFPVVYFILLLFSIAGLGSEDAGIGLVSGWGVALLIVIGFAMFIRGMSGPRYPGR